MNPIKDFARSPGEKYITKTPFDPAHTTSTEHDRRQEEHYLNHNRIIRYNNERIHRGLAPVDYTAYMNKRHATTIPADNARPENRDNIVLFGR